MNDLKILAVKNSWSYVILHSEEAGELFYGRLFELEPSLRAMFKGDLKAQSKKLMDMVTLVVAKLQKLEDIETEVKALGQRHVRYGTRPEHYAVVGEALLWTLENGLGPRWNEEVKQAWTEVYTILASAMIKAAEAPAPEKSPVE
jgi:hemoglobin-like flavoprotein